MMNKIVEMSDVISTVLNALCFDSPELVTIYEMKGGDRVIKYKEEEIIVILRKEGIMQFLYEGSIYEYDLLDTSFDVESLPIEPLSGVSPYTVAEAVSRRLFDTYRDTDINKLKERRMI